MLGKIGRLALLTQLGLTASCARQAPVGPAEAADAPSRQTSPSGQQTAGSRANRATPSPEREPRVQTPAPIVQQFTRELESPVTRIALDAPPHVAALGSSSVFIHDRTGWREERLPKAVQDALSPRLDLFYGRDFRVRLVGTHTGLNGGLQSFYYRSLPGGLKPAPAELGRLGNPRDGALVAVLGTADPEVVCRPGDVCLIKRLSGWTSLPAPADLSHATIAGSNGWVLVGKQLMRADREWIAQGPPGPWQAPSALFAVGERVFVLEAAPPRVHQLSNDAWESFESPVGAPSSLWGARATGLWLAGATGVAYFDGSAWRPVQGAPSGVSAVLGRSAEDVWFAGSTGLFRLGPQG